MYADKQTKSMSRAIDEIQRRRKIQEDYNKEHGITPQGIKKAIRDITERIKAVAESHTPYMAIPTKKEDVARLIKDLEAQMKTAAKVLDFEKAALIRDRIFDLRKELEPIEIVDEKKMEEHNQIIDDTKPIEITRQEKREKKLQNKREKMPQHGKGIARIYRDAVIKRTRKSK
jgi:excinuclease UvrABC nuclease subunit